MKAFLNTGVVLRSFGFSVFIVGICMVSALPVALYYGEDTISAIILSASITLIAGIIPILTFRKSSLEGIGEREAFTIVLFTWFTIGLFGMLPYLFSGAIPVITDAYFETISGFTTTGASILKDIETLPKSILYWRNLTQWLGGMGVLVLVIAILPGIGYGGVKLFIAEMPGPSTNKIHPRIRNTAIRLWQIYALYTFILALLLYAGGMNLFESVCHAFSGVATGGFSPKNTSLAGYAPHLQIIITVFMFFGGVNFVFHYFLIRGRIQKIIRNEELLAFALIIFVISIVIAIVLFSYNTYDSFSESLRHSFFQTVSIITTTGYVSTDYMEWPQEVWVVLFALFFIGGMIGSTAGGIKITRIYVLFKNIRAELRRFIHPSAIIPIRVNKQTIPEIIIRNFFIVFFAYVVFFIIGSVYMSLFLDSPHEAMGASISFLGGIGPSFGQFGPSGNYSQLHDAGKWMGSFLMVIGRLEVIPVIMLFHYAFWKK